MPLNVVVTAVITSHNQAASRKVKEKRKVRKLVGSYENTIFCKKQFC